jgi:uncharacterized delta-60 repeat protein
MKNKLLPFGSKFIILFMGILSGVFSLCGTLNAQTTTQWVKRYNGPGNAYDGGREVVMDSQGNVYVVGLSEGSGTALDYLTIKYSPAGTELWAVRYDAGFSNNDEAWGIALDGAGNVYVTGGSQSNTNRDMLTIKYNSAGVQQWTARYNGIDNGYDEAIDIAVDSIGNVYVGGTSSLSASGFDFATVKYNSAGVQQWVSRYDGTASGFDQIWKVNIDPSGSIIVTGESDGAGTGPDYTTVKYNSSGTELWVKRYDGPANDIDGARGIAIAPNGDVIITGYSTGTGTNNDYATIKYSSSGTELWVKRYNGPGNNRDVSWSVVLDAAGSSYITGGSTGSGTGIDFATIKYSPSGTEEWVRRYTSAGNKLDEATAITMDNAGFIYVGGQATIGSRPDFFALKYTSAGDEVGRAQYNGPDNLDDYIIAILIDTDGEAYVTGTSESTAQGFDFVTVKYGQLVNVTPVSAELPETFLLSQNYPNPFNPVTNIRFAVTQTGFVSLTVYDINGKEVTGLVNRELNPGTYSVNFDAGALTSGAYFYRLNFTSPSAVFSETKKMLLVK